VISLILDEMVATVREYSTGKLKVKLQPRRRDLSKGQSVSADGVNSGWAGVQRSGLNETDERPFTMTFVETDLTSPYTHTLTRAQSDR
jgi:hypothetical protein